jgi:hypothetical protein
MREALTIRLRIITRDGHRTKVDYLLAISSDTVNLFLPLALRLDNTLRPLAVDILSLNPCLLRLFLFEG